jgi:hypothetical protein
VKSQSLLIALTVVNLGLLVFLLSQTRAAQARGSEGVLRGRALQIVDEEGRTRASIDVLPPSKAAGKSYPETVILRLSDPNGRPSVKLTCSVEGTGLALGGETDATYAQLGALGADSSLRLTATRGRLQLIKP